MTAFRQMRGFVYILENELAQRVKVGMTINEVELRLRDVTATWLERKVTCQLCGARRLATLNSRAPRVMPKHTVSGRECPGGNARPLEHDTSLATAHLEQMNIALPSLSGSKKGSMVRRIATLEQRLLLRSHHPRAVGRWRISTTYYTECAEEVEIRSHGHLAEYLDKNAPLGEVFGCSPSRAREAVEASLKELGLLEGVTRNDFSVASVENHRPS